VVIAKVAGSFIPELLLLVQGLVYNKLFGKDSESVITKNSEVYNVKCDENHLMDCVVQ
jgi:hypothetical protein